MGPIRAILVLALAALPVGAQAPEESWNRGRAVQQRRTRPAEPPSTVDWGARIGALLKDAAPGDLVITAVGDVILNERISTLKDARHQELYRLLQESDVAFGNLEGSLNARPELQRPFYNFRADPDFAWELAGLGFNLVSLANNHTLDFGPEGLQETLRALDRSRITHAGAGMTLEEARSPGVFSVQGQTRKVALLSYLRFWTSRYRSRDPHSASVATLDPAVILVAREGREEAVEGVQEADIRGMEEDILLARRRGHRVVVTLHNHDVSHNRAFGIQEVTPPNDELMYRRALAAGAEAVIGHGPHVLRGVELREGRPILYSLGNFIYQYRTPSRIPVDLTHQRDPEMAKVPGQSVWDRRDTEEVMDSVVARLVFNGDRLRRLQLIPVGIEDEGPLYGVPRLAEGAQATRILERLKRLSLPYGTRFEARGWYLEALLP